MFIPAFCRIRPISLSCGLLLGNIIVFCSSYDPHTGLLFSMQYLKRVRSLNILHMHCIHSWMQLLPVHSSTAKMNSLGHHGQHIFPASKCVFWNQHPCWRNQDISIDKNTTRYNQIRHLKPQFTHLSLQIFFLLSKEQH